MILIHSYRVCNGVHPSYARSSIPAISSLFGLSPKCRQFFIMWPRSHVAAPHTHMFRSPGNPTDASLPGWQPVLSALGWPSAMYATAVCDHSGVVPLGGRHTSSDCSGYPPTVPATSRHELLRAYTGEAGRLSLND